MEGLDLAAVLPGGGLAGVVVTLLVWVQRVAAADRKEYREQIAIERARVIELDKAIDVEVTDLRRRIADAETVAQGEREIRRDFEVSNERLRVQVAGSEARVEWLTGELGRSGSLGYPPAPASST